MARGYPAVWSTVFGLPFLIGGGYLYFIPQQNLQLPSMLIPPSDLQTIGVPLMLFGFFIIVVGIYIQIAAPPEISIQKNEELIREQHPSQRVAVSKIITSIPFLIISAFLLFFTLYPYIYPTIAFLFGLYFFSSGIKTYWVNTLTSYYVTTNRVVSEYRFISLRRQEIPLNKIRGVEERKSIMEAIVGLGNIRIASGGGGGSVQLNIRNIYNSAEFADEIRNLIN